MTCHHDTKLVALHEAGHVVAALALEMPVSSVSVEPDSYSMGRVAITRCRLERRHFMRDPVTAVQLSYCEIAVWLAGYSAETVWARSTLGVSDLIDASGRDHDVRVAMDRAKTAIRCARGHARGIDEDAAAVCGHVASSVERFLRLDAVAEVGKRIARALIARKHLDHGELCALAGNSLRKRPMLRGLYSSFSMVGPLVCG